MASTAAGPLRAMAMIQTANAHWQCWAQGRAVRASHRQSVRPHHSGRRGNRRHFRSVHRSRCRRISRRLCSGINAGQPCAARAGARPPRCLGCGARRRNAVCPSALQPWRVTSMAVCDSHRAITISAPVVVAPAANSRMSLLLPRPGSPTTLTTHICPPLKASSSSPRSASRPISGPSSRPITVRSDSTRSRRRAGTGSPAPLTVTHSVGPSTDECKRAVDAVHMTPPGSAAASIRWAIPTGCPTAV